MRRSHNSSFKSSSSVWAPSNPNVIFSCHCGAFDTPLLLHTRNVSMQQQLLMHQPAWTTELKTSGTCTAFLTLLQRQLQVIFLSPFASGDNSNLHVPNWDKIGKCSKCHKCQFVLSFFTKKISSQFNGGLVEPQ